MLTRTNVCVGLRLRTLGSNLWRCSRTGRHHFLSSVSDFSALDVKGGDVWRGRTCTSRYKSTFVDSRHTPGAEDSYDETEEYDEGDEMKEVYLDAGKSHYRRREKLPEWIQAKKQKIQENRTAAQIRRCLKSWMIKAGRHNKRAPATKDRPLEWKETAKNLGATRVSDGTLDVKAYGPEETVAYMHYFFPGKFSIHRRVFRDLTAFLEPDFKPKRMLDFGCGPGTAATAAIDVWGDDHDMLYCGVDMSRSMIDAAKIMLEERAMNKVFYDRVGGISKRALEEGESYDFIVCSYTLSELANDHLRRTATQLLYELLSVNGILLLIEGGDPSGSHTTRTARKFLLDTGASNYRSTNSRDSRVSKISARAPRTLPSVVAPCTHSAECPLTGGTWCSFSQSVEGGFLSKTNEEKFSYVAIQKVVDEIGDEEQQQDGVSNTGDEDEDEIHLAYPLRQKEWGRIIRSPIKNHGHVIMDVCYPQGFIGRSVVSKGREGRMPIVYRAARKSQWGGLYPAYEYSSTLSYNNEGEKAIPSNIEK